MKNLPLSINTLAKLLDGDCIVDMTIKLGLHIYVMEIKVVDTDKADELDQNPALKQIQEKGYAEKYRGRDGVVVHEVGLVFSRTLRNLLVWR